MNGFRHSLIVACAATLAALACGKKPDAATGGPPAAAAPARVAEAKSEKPAPYTYPPPVKGHFREADTADFDLVDGVAYPAKVGGTVVYAVSKPIASPALAESPCPMTHARALTTLRNAGYVEVMVDGAGKSQSLVRGTPFGGTGREQGSRSWSSELSLAGGRATGNVQHKDYGGFEFGLPVSTPKVTEVSENDRAQQKHGDPLGVTPTREQVTEAYEAVRKAALAKDLPALLAAQVRRESMRRSADSRGSSGLASYTDRSWSRGRRWVPDDRGGAIVGTGATRRARSSESTISRASVSFVTSTKRAIERITLLRAGPENTRALAVRGCEARPRRLRGRASQRRRHRCRVRALRPAIRPRHTITAKGHSASLSTRFETFK